MTGFEHLSNTARALDDPVNAERAKSQTALIEELVEREKARHDMEQEGRELDEAWSAAMESAAYHTEQAQVVADFVAADAESARGIS